MKRFKLGLQLFSVRDYMEKDMEATLKAVADMGYDCVEFAGYFGKTAEEVKALCDKYGLEPVSVHQGYDPFLSDTDNAVGYLKTLGVKYSAIPWADSDGWKNNYDERIADIKKVGKILGDSGIKLMYHNHGFELKIKHGDKRLLDALYDDVDSSLLIPELDLCWVHYAGCDPIEYIKKYGDVEEVLHLKDFECTKLAAGPVYDLIDNEGKTGTGNDKVDNGFEFRPIGSGRQDVPAIMKAAEDTKIEYVIVEQDGHPQNTSLEDAKISIDYLKSIGY